MLTEQDAMVKMTGMATSKLAEFLSNVLDKPSDWSIQALNRIERTISSHLDHIPQTAKQLGRKHNLLKAHIREMRGIQQSQKWEEKEYYAAENAKESHVVALIKQGLTLEQVAKECGCSINYVVCTKAEIKRGLHAGEKIRKHR